jgi:hypothetical protein
MNPTRITLDGGALRVDAPYHPEIVARCKQCSGEWDKAAKVWRVALSHADTLLALLPRAEYSYDALCACWDAQDSRGRHFAMFLAQVGVELAFDDAGAVCAVGGHVSPLLQDEIAKRADALRPWVGRLRVQAPGICQPARPAPTPVVVGPESGDEESRMLGLWLTGVKAAAVKAEAEQIYKRPAYRRKAKA